MLTRIVWLPLFLLYVLPAMAQVTVSGKVIDRETSEPLAYVNVLVENTHWGSISGQDGQFVITGLPAGEYTISAGMMGYYIQKHKITVRETEDAHINFTLTPRLLQGEEVIITAARASRYMPVTFSNISKEELKNNYIVQDVPVLLAELPSTTFYSENGNGIGYNYLNIRGFDQRRIAVMINGIPQNDPEDHNVYWVDFPDLIASTEDIQVQRGGGSAFYGTPAIGGSVNIITNQFADTRRTVIEAGYGSYNTQKYSLTYSSGVIDNKYSLNGRLSKMTSDGYRERAWVDFNSYYFNLSRYDRNLTTSINIYGGPIADGLAYNGLPRFYMKDKKNRKNNWSYFDADNASRTVNYYTERRRQEVENFSQPHYELINKWKINAYTTLHNTLFYVIGQGYFDYDGSWINYYGDDVVRQYFRLTAENGFDTTAKVPSNTLIRAWVGNRQFGWLPRVEWEKGTHHLTVGGEFRVHRSLHWGKMLWAENLPPDFDPDYKFYDYRAGKNIVSGYAHHIWKISPAWSVMSDLQMVYNEYRLIREEYANRRFRVPYYFLNPRFGITFRPSETWHLYVNLSHTSREPRLTNLYDAAGSSVPAEYSSDFGAIPYPQFHEKSPGVYDYSRPLVKPEKLFNIELGSGYEIKDRLLLNASFFWMDFRDEIIKKGTTDRFGQPITTNADRTRHAGLELSGSYRLLRDLEIYGNGTYSRNRLIRYTTVAKDTNGQYIPVRLNGNPIAGFPDLMGMLGAKYRWRAFYANLNARHVGAFYTDNFRNPEHKVPAYTVCNLMLAWQIQKPLGLQAMEFRLQINNLFNNLYFASGEKDEFFPAAERNYMLSCQITM